MRTAGTLYLRRVIAGITVERYPVASRMSFDVQDYKPKAIYYAHNIEVGTVESRTENDFGKKKRPVLR